MENQADGSESHQQERARGHRWEGNGTAQGQPLLVTSILPLSTVTGNQLIPTAEDGQGVNREEWFLGTDWFIFPPNEGE